MRHDHAKGRGDTTELVCNECSTVIGVMHAAYARELAGLITLELNCPHCGALNRFPELDAVDSFICTVCGKPVQAV